jgi:predicted DNA-binding ribbon-helix-helix protein
VAANEAGNRSPKSLVVKTVKRSLVIGGHKTSVSLEDAFWALLKEIALSRSMILSNLIVQIDEARGENSNLSSAIRLFVLDHYKKLASASAAANPDREHRLGVR